MSHGMTNTDEMFSVREAPWHFRETNSTVLADHPDPSEVLVHAGLDWTVNEEDVYRKLERVPEDQAPITRVTFPKLPNWKLLSRSDNDGILHVARDSYTVLQNVVGAELMDALLGQDTAVKYETGGSIRGGATCYLSARLDEAFFVDGDDSPTFPYGVVTWSHDGSGAMQVRATNVRVVCQNTISFSEAEAVRGGRNFVFRHTKNVLERVDQARDVIRGIREDAEGFVELANELAKVTVTDEQREEFVELFIPAPATTNVISDRVLDNITTARALVRQLLGGDSLTIPERHRSTAYGLVLAGTEYLDHLRGYRNQDTYLGRTLLRDEALKARLVPMVKKLVSV